ncbi:fibronectin type III domain-containing protein [Candidatus Collierbacteria bacterium]|nr:fibronectin type III domain-containing protein [Candidatus Collierbacteria bacterium]
MNKKGLLAKRIPTILGITILIAGLTTGIVLVGRQQGLSIKAGPTATPKNVKVSNRGEKVLTISWTTDVPVTGFIKYSDNPAKLTLPAGDIRDQISGSSNTYTTHYVEITGLSADKTYYFEIGSGSQTYGDAGKPYQVRTLPSTTAGAEDVITGKILLPSSQGAGGVIVYVEVTGGETLSTLTKNDGTWRLALSSSRDSKGQLVAYDPEKAQLTITAQGGAAGVGTAFSDTEHDNPVPDITLGKTHNFASGEIKPVEVDTLAGQEGKGFNNLLSQAEKELGTDPEATYSVKLANPEFAGEQVATSTPEFRGMGPVATEIKITVNSAEEQTGQTVVGSDGSWSWSAPLSLEPGEHTVTIEYKDEKGIWQKFARKFTVMAAGSGGSLPAFTATPSATPTVSPSPTASPTATPTISPSPTATPTGGVSMPSTESGIPAPGVLTPTITLLIVGLGLFISGLFWNLKLNRAYQNNG